MTRKKLPATYEISPELVEIRDAQAERESQIKRPVRPKATLDPKLEAEREALIQKEATLKDRSVKEAPSSFGI